MKRSLSSEAISEVYMTGALQDMRACISELFMATLQVLRDAAMQSQLSVIDLEKFTVLLKHSLTML